MAQAARPRYKGHWRVACPTCRITAIRDPDEEPNHECGTPWVLCSPVKPDAPEPDGRLR